MTEVEIPDDGFTIHRDSDGDLSIVFNPRPDCICPPRLIGIDLACRVHGIPAVEGQGGGRS